MSLLFPRTSRNIPSDNQGIPQLFRALDDALFNSQSVQSATRISPKVDIEETPQAFEIKADVPGVKREDLSIDFDDENTLTIHGKVEHRAERTSPDDSANGGKAEKGKEGKGGRAQDQSMTGRRVWQSERLVGEFSRSFSFPNTINREAIKANLDHGILSVVIPKKDAQQAKRIAID